MFSKRERQQIQAKSLQQWQAEQREVTNLERLREANLAAIALLPPDPMFTAQDIILLRSCVYPISPA